MQSGGMMKVGKPIDRKTQLELELKQIYRAEELKNIELQNKIIEEQKQKDAYKSQKDIYQEYEYGTPEQPVRQEQPTYFKKEVMTYHKFTGVQITTFLLTLIFSGVSFINTLIILYWIRLIA